jgi:hypothetical protein
VLIQVGAARSAQTLLNWVVPEPSLFRWILAVFMFGAGHGVGVKINI